ncbi:hypothetical protein [Burkholderia lata]|uniref:hypothetical protein n=1 Tax=Burkholderia lata (strain ATCC 17760 / DSM 23089 / LMG 22485 / NCIMB 9086 / R18194 / 383) TaxID=482957 RepID=UPI0012EB0061|nr:hypothetical protein [Burkholderia lata]
MLHRVQRCASPGRTALCIANEQPASCRLFAFLLDIGVRALCFVDFLFSRLIFRANRSIPSGCGRRRPRVMPESVIFRQIVSATGMDTRRVPKYFR